MSKTPSLSINLKREWRMQLEHMYNSNSNNNCAAAQNLAQFPSIRFDFNVETNDPIKVHCILNYIFQDAHLIEENKQNGIMNGTEIAETRYVVPFLHRSGFRKLINYVVNKTSN